MLGNARGGFDRVAIYEVFLEVCVDADTEMLLGWNGMTFHAIGFQLRGQELTTTSVVPSRLLGGKWGLFRIDAYCTALGRRACSHRAVDRPAAACAPFSASA